MPKIPESGDLPSQVMQKKWYTCLAANLAAILHSYGIKTKEWKDERGLPAMRDVDDILVAELYYCLSNSFERYEAFDVLPKLTALMPPTRTINAHKDAKPCFEEWWATVTDHITRESYVLISYKTEGGSHIVTAYQVENGILHVYNPAKMPTRETLEKHRLDEMWKRQMLNHDILVVSKECQQGEDEVSLVDKDVELLKVRAAIDDYRTSWQVDASVGLGFLLSFVIVLASLAFNKPSEIQGGALVVFVAVMALVWLLVHSSHGKYRKGVRKLDGYLKDIEGGKAIPSLEDLCSW